jgi:glucose-6-phosphate isomerase
MGGSSLGTQTIYDFLKHKIKKKFVFSDNLQVSLIKIKKNIQI